MSEWFDIQEEDISTDVECKEVHLLVTDNGFGNVYGILTFDQIENIYNEITSATAPKGEKNGSIKKILQ